MYMLMSSGPFTLRKLMLHSVATAFATKVFPVPKSQQPNLLTPTCALYTCAAAAHGHMTKSDQTDCQTGKQADRRMHVHTDRQTDIQADRHIQTDRADMQADRPTRNDAVLATTAV